MSKKLKILVVLLVIILVLFLYLVLTSRPLDGGAGVKVDNQALVSDYKDSAKKILADYWQLAGSKDTTVEEVEYLRNQLLGLKGIPKDFQELHINLVTALDKLNNYLENGDEKEKEESGQMVSQATADYDWLSNRSDNN